MSRPEHQAPPEIYYGDTEARKYTANTRNQDIQAEMALRAIELMALPPHRHPALILDIGCGSGLSGEILTEMGHEWIGYDISPSMLSVGLERDVEGDMILSDAGHGCMFRAGSFDGAISISVLQWLCNADTSYNSPGARLSTFFTTLYASLTRGARCVFQFYPENDDQVQFIMSQATKAGFGGGLVVDYPNSVKAKKIYLVLWVGGEMMVGPNGEGQGVKQELPKALEFDAPGAGQVRHETRKAGDPRRERAMKKKGESMKQYIQRKKDLDRSRGKAVPHDSKYSGKKLPARSDQTDAFHALLRECQSKGIESEPAPKPSAVVAKQRAAAESWTKEAYRVVRILSHQKRHIASLYTFLATIRRPYLDISSKGRRTGRPDSDAGPSGDESKKEDAFAKWQHITTLTDAERDEIDFQVKLVIKQCLDRVQELERGEKLRKQAVDKSLQSAGGTAFAPLMLLKGGAIARQQAASDAVAAHHAAVTQYLSEQLARASSIQATLQARRVDAQQQRHQKLSDGVKHARHGSQHDAPDLALRGSVGALDGQPGKDVTQELSKEQVQVFEEEASALIQSLQNDLQAIHVAEQQLHDISELQTRIVQHLQEQNEHTNQLHTEAAGHGEQVTSGNQQLRKAKERNRQANRFLSLFFVVSGLLLLLMHCMYSI